ncbi:MAG: hypothetical protein U1E66_07030 [Rhodospirillales bacterium]
MRRVEAAAWYDQERNGLGKEFARAIDAAITLLADDIIPLTTVPGAAGARGANRLVLKRFPFDIVLRELDDEVLIVAVAHRSRRPGYWRNRLRG